MTKKHFEALATALAQVRPAEKEDDAEWVRWLLSVESVADVCSSTNPRFDRGKFVKACNER